MLQVEVAEAPDVGPTGPADAARCATPRTDRCALDTYLGTYGHVTGFQRETRRDAPHAPADAPEVTEGGGSLAFHTEIEEPGDYRLFVQVRVDGFLHTVPVAGRRSTTRPRPDHSSSAHVEPQRW